MPLRNSAESQPERRYGIRCSNRLGRTIHEAHLWQSSVAATNAPFTYPMAVYVAYPNSFARLRTIKQEENNVMRAFLSTLPLIAICSAAIGASSAADRVKIANGLLEANSAPKDGVLSFKGIPFAQPPVGALRWREPQPVKNWSGTRNADQFGSRCMQRTAAGADYWFRSSGMSEDCLYLNIWTPTKSDREKLPVLVYVFGGGFQNGDGSEP